MTADDFDEGAGTPAQSPSFRCRRWRGGFVMEPCDGSADPDRWDDNGVLSPMPPGKWQMQLAFRLGGSTRWVYGQRVFDSLEAAKDAARAGEKPSCDPGIRFGYQGIVLLRQGATDLSDPLQALIVNDLEELRKASS